MKLSQIIFFIIVLCSLFVNASKAFADYAYTQIYLPSDVPSVVHCIFKDKHGFIWMGTRSGLFRYDGQNISEYNKDESSPLGNYIYKIFQDINGELWVLTNNGIYIYNYSINDFTAVNGYDGKPLMAFSAINHKGKIILGSKNVIYSYDASKKELAELISFNEINDYNVSDIIIVGNDSLVCSDRWYGMKLVDLKKKKSENIFTECEKDIICTYKDKSGKIWISSYNQGVRCFDKKFNLLRHYSKGNSGISSNIVLSIIEHKGDIWFGTDGDGISILDQTLGEFKTLKHVPGENNYSLPSNSIINLYEDYYGNVWIGSIYYGLVCIHEVSMRTYNDALPGNSNGLSQSTALFLYKAEDNRLWIGTNGGGVNAYDMDSGKFIHYPTTFGDKITSICSFGKNKLLIFNFAQGLFIFDTENGTKKPFTIVDEHINERLCHHGNSVFIYRNTPNSILFLADFVYWYDENTRTFSVIKEKNGVSIKIGSLVAVSGDSRYTYLKDIKNIYRLDNRARVLEHIYAVPDGVSVTSVSIDNSGIFWVGTDKGLLWYDAANNSSDWLKTELFKRVFSVVCVDNKVLIGAESMLFCWEKDKRKFIFYGESNGVMPNEYMPDSKFVNTNGSVFMGGVRGLLKIDSLQDYDMNSTISLNLSEVELNGTKTFFSSDGNIPHFEMSESGSIVLRVFANSEDIFRKKMYSFGIYGPGVTKNIETYNSELALHSLSAGTYRIMASCTTRDGDQTNEKCLMVLKVIPPWYKTGWLFLACIILLIMTFAFINMQIIRKKTEKHNFIIKEREKQMYEDKIRFLINISHELRTPLTLIHAPLQRILKTMDMDNRLYLPLKGIFRQTQRMKNLINMVLDVRKIEVGGCKLNLVATDINEYVKYIGHDFIEEAKAIGGDLIFNLDIEAGIAEIDRQKFDSILTNFLVNALKHSSSGGYITISTENTDNGCFVRISVSDQGLGLKNVDSSRLFSRFYQGAGEETGTGIGLSYSKILVEMHGGKIGAFNNDDKGATFYFELPRRIENNAKYESAHYLNKLVFDFNSKEDNNSGKLEDINLAACTVIVVDDNADLRNFLKDTLKGYFKKVITASEGEEAFMLTRSYMPDIIISDVMMPGMNGYQLCKAIKQDFSVSHLPVILLTAKDDNESKLSGYKNGADDYLVKPFDVDMLIEVIKNRLRNRNIARKAYADKGQLPVAENTTFSQVDESFIIRLNSIINVNIGNPELGVNTICDELGMSRTSVYSKLKNLTNMGINDYVNKIKMEKAIEMLSTTDMSLAEIATTIGFTSQSYFSTVFKLYTGKTPTAYRKEVRGKIQTG